MMTKNRVCDREIYLELDEIFDGKTIQQSINELNRLEKENVHYNIGETAKLQLDWGYESTSVSLIVCRDETDKEYSARIEKEKKVKEKLKAARDRRKEKARQVLLKTEEDERAEYERLRSKFEK